MEKKRKENKKNGKLQRQITKIIMKQWFLLNDENIAKIIERETGEVMSSESVRKRGERLGLPGKRESIKKQTDFDLRLDIEKGKTSAIEKKYRLLLGKYRQLEEEKESIIQIKAPIKVEPIVAAYKGRGIHEATAFMLLSDFHVDEIVDPKKVSGRNSFDPEVDAPRRSELVFVNGAKLIKKEQQDARIDNLVLWFGGDFISNNIHEELPANTAMPPISAIKFAQQLLVRGIDYLLNNTKLKITIVCNVGNHARITKKIHISNEQANSLEDFMYSNLKDYYSSTERIHFVIANGYLQHLDVYGYKFRFQHGHAIRYQGGVGGLDVPLRRAILQWNDKKEFVADYDIVGHFHQYIPHKFYIVNGSLIGYNSFALFNKFALDMPQQAFFLCLKDKGVVGHFPIFVEKM